jgi:hypothetical protein
MNPRERYVETLLFGKPDRVPFGPGGPRESTFATWHQQGLPQNVSFVDALVEILPVPREAFHHTEGGGMLARMIPMFEEKVLEHKDGHYVVQDWMGATTEISDRFDYTYIRGAKDFVTRKWHRFAVLGPEEWEKVAWRYDPKDPSRYPDAARVAQLQASDMAIAVGFNGPFWQMREWVGMEGLCLMMAEQPEFVDSMARFWLDYTLELLENTLRLIRVDSFHISEDMAYKAHSMVSPAMVRRFLQPSYLAWKELLRSYNVPLFDMDSDGEVSVLVPIWLESGINVCDPMEVAAGNDIVAFRQRFGKQMAYTGGIDKRAIAVGGQVMRDEVLRVVPPLFAEGGYIPGCDHGVPPDISWPAFVDYARLLAQLTGWL